MSLLSFSGLVIGGENLPTRVVLPSHFPIGSSIRILKTFYGTAQKPPLTRSTCADPDTLTIVPDMVFEIVSVVNGTVVLNMVLENTIFEYILCIMDGNMWLCHYRFPFDPTYSVHVVVEVTNDAPSTAEELHHLSQRYFDGPLYAEENRLLNIRDGVEEPPLKKPHL